MTREFIGTGRANHAGSSMTITAPKNLREYLRVDEEGLDVAWFVDEGMAIVVPASEVTIR